MRAAKNEFAVLELADSDGVLELVLGTTAGHESRKRDSGGFSGSKERRSEGGGAAVGRGGYAEGWV